MREIIYYETKNVTQIKTENIVTKIDLILDSIHEIYMEKHQHWY